jgi:hypothetical protein
VSRNLARLIALGTFTAISISLAFAPAPKGVHAESRSGSRSKYKLSYTKDGGLVPPLQYREWIYLTSGIDMSYVSKAPSAEEGSTFDNVFVNPEAYKAFLINGTWPDKTVLVLEARRASSKGSINQSGHFQSGAVVGLELHVKDEKRFPGKWAFFDVANETKATLIPSGAPCYSCHAQHGAVDTTFIQFYPTLLPTAQARETLSANYLKDESNLAPH